MVEPMIILDSNEYSFTYINDDGDYFGCIIDQTGSGQDAHYPVVLGPFLMAEDDFYF